MKKNKLSKKDLKTWNSFISNIKNIEDKDETNFSSDVKPKKIKKIDLHGMSLDIANHKVSEFIDEAFKNGCRKLIIITGKGLRSQQSENPYVSKNMGILKNSVPEFLMNSEIKNKISSISPAHRKDGGSGAFYIFLKKKL